MPSGKKSESLEHISFTTVNTQNQSKLNGTSVDSTFSCKSHEASSTIRSPNNEVTSNLKLCLSDELDFHAKIKKFRESREEICSLNNENHVEEHHISLLIEKLGKIAESDIINRNKHHVSNESNNRNSEKSIFINNCINDPINTDSYSQEICCPSKMSICKEGSQNIKEKSNNVSNDVNNCVPQVLKINTESTGNNDDIRPSSSENVGIAENSKHKDVDGDFPIIQNIESSKNDDLQLCKDNIAQMSTKKTCGIETNEPENNNKSIENDDLQLCKDNIAQMSTKKTSGIETITNEPENNNKSFDNDDLQLGKDNIAQMSTKSTIGIETITNEPKNNNKSIDNDDLQSCKDNIAQMLTKSNCGIEKITNELENNNESSENNDVQLCKDTIAQISTKSDNGIETITNELENHTNEVEYEISNFIGDKNGKMIESDNDSDSDSIIVNDLDSSNTNKKPNDEDDILKVGIKPKFMKDQATLVLFELFKDKKNIAEQWVSYVKFKCMEYLSNKGRRGVERRETEYTIEQQKIWIEKFKALIKSLSSYDSIMERHIASLGYVPRQTKICRSVALQADICSFKENDSLVPLRKLKPPIQQPDNRNPVHISIDDDNDMCIIDTQESTLKPSSSNTKRNIKAKKSSRTARSTSSSSVRSTSPSIPSAPKKLKLSTTKAVPPAIPINSAVIHTDSIDLTGNDEVNEVPEILNRDKTLKVIRCSKINTSASATSSTQFTRDLSKQALPENLTIIETSKLPDSSHYIVKQRNARESNQLRTGSKLKTVSLEPNSSLKPFVKLLPLPSVVDPNQLQPSASTVTLIPRQINHLASQLNSSQLIRPQSTMPQLIPSHIGVVQSTTRPQITMPQLIRSQIGAVHSTRPQFAMVQSTTRPQITTVQSTTRPQVSMVQSTRVTTCPVIPQRFRPLLPVPPAIPLTFTHPAPLPPLPNQSSLPSWKKLPSAPVVTVTPQGLNEAMLSWVVPKYSRPTVATITTYQIFSYQVNLHEQPRSTNWKQIGTADALPLPMSCTVTQLNRQQTYYIAIRAVDVHTRVGPFSLPKYLNLN